MNALMTDMASVVLIGIGATAAMDAWLLLLKRVGVPALNMAFIGRWIGHVARGTWSHAAIAKAAPIHGELALGWITHYAVGIGFAAVAVAICGPAWTREPSLLPALYVGIGSVVAPWFVMQPAMGAGIASSRTSAPLKNALRSLVNHAVFGAGLYVAAVLVNTTGVIS
jgi:hypothetical protein